MNIFHFVMTFLKEILLPKFIWNLCFNKYRHFLLILKSPEVCFFVTSPPYGQQFKTMQAASSAPTWWEVQWFRPFFPSDFNLNCIDLIWFVVIRFDLSFPQLEKLNLLRLIKWLFITFNGLIPSMVDHKCTELERDVLSLAVCLGGLGFTNLKCRVPSVCYT